MTLGEEYWNILPKTKAGSYDYSSKSPVQLSLRTKLIYYLWVIAFPYIFSKWIIPLYRTRMQKAAQGII